jgi:hypothetical protein
MVFGPIKLASGFFRGVRVVHSFSYLYCPMYVSLCSCDLCLFGNSGVQHILCCVFVLLSLRLVYPILQVSLFFSSSCVPYVASFSVLFFVLCTLCCRFLCSFPRLVYLMLPVSLFFSSSCVPYVAGFSVLFFVLCTLCCQFLCSFLRLVYLMLPVSLFLSSSCVPYVANFSRLLIF